MIHSKIFFLGHTWLLVNAEATLFCLKIQCVAFGAGSDAAGSVEFVGSSVHLCWKMLLLVLWVIMPHNEHTSDLSK